MLTPRRHSLSAALALAPLLCAGALCQSTLAQSVTIPADTTEPADAQQPDTDRRPLAARRVVRHFDFEEQQTNPLDIPAGWIRAQDDPLVPRVRPGFPIWNLAELDYTVAATGSGSVRCDIEGGSASLRLRPGVLPVFPLGEYAVSALVRTEGLSVSRPRIVVRALDRAGNTIPGSQRQTILQHLDDDWQELEVVLPGDFQDAAYLQIDLEVIQPEVFQRATLGDRQVWEQDFDGAAWFDDVTVMQVPQLHLRTSSPLGVVIGPDTPSLQVELRDLAAEELTATTTVFDARRKPVAESRRSIRSGRVAWDWSPELDAFGWYSALVEVRSAGTVIAQRTCDFAWVPAPDEDRQRYRSGPAFDGPDTNAPQQYGSLFTAQLSELPEADAEEIARALRGLGVHAVTLPVWERSLLAQHAPQRVDLLSDITEALRAEWIEPRLSLTVVPDELAVPLRLRPDNLLGALTADRSFWAPYLDDAMDRLGTSAIRWQLGSPGSSAVHDRATAAADLAGVRGELATLIPGVELGAGWRVELPAAQAAASGLDSVSVLLPSWTATTPPALLTDPWSDIETIVPEYVLEPLPAEHHSERDIAADLARRVVELKGVLGDTDASVGIAVSWHIDRGDRGSFHPTPAAAALRTAADKMTGRRFVGTWAVEPGIRCLVFAPAADDTNRGGLIVAWATSATPTASRLLAPLGFEPITMTDVFGNTSPIEPIESETGTGRTHDVPLTSEPVYIEGIDTELVRFLASLIIAPGDIQSVAGERQYEIVLDNPWPIAATGRLVVTEPGGYDPDAQTRDRTWEITPRSIPFEIAAGESARLPVMIAFSRAVEAGAVEFVLDMQIVAERDYGWVRARVPARVGLDGVELDVAYRKPMAGPDADLIVEATVTNTGETTRSFDAFAFAAGMPRVRASIGALEPGQSAVRYFPFSNAAATLGGKRVVVSIAEADGPGRLTKGVDVLRR